jgi:hypothetical protein
MKNSTHPSLRFSFVILAFLTCLGFSAGARAAVLTDVVVNGGIEGEPFVDGSDTNWTAAWALGGVWVFNPGASDRIGDLASGGNTGGYAANGSGGNSANGKNTMYGVFDVSESTLGGALAGGNAEFSFDILNNTGSDISYVYSIWYADETATGKWGGFQQIAGANMPFGGGSTTLLHNGTGTALSGDTGWNTDRVKISVDLDAINFAADGVASISNLSDVNRIAIGIEFNNYTTNLDAGIDNVSFQMLVVPEPSSVLLLGFGLLACGVFGKFRKS